MLDDISAVIELLERAGLHWIPVPLGQKTTTERRWQEPRRRPVPSEPTNLGLLILASSGVIDLDLDSAVTAKAAACLVTPGPGVVRYGRRSKPVSHVLVREGGAYQGPRQVVDPDTRSLLLEARVDKQYSLIPPSVHPSNERICWVDDPQALLARAPVGTAETLFRRIAAAALLVQVWEPGIRHEASLALAGWLLRVGWPLEEIEMFVSAVAAAAGDDDARDRVTAVVTTAQRIDDHAVTGFSSLASLIGEARANLVSKLLVLPTRRAASANATLEVVLNAVAKRDDIFVIDRGASLDCCAWDGTSWKQGPFGLLRSAVSETVQELGLPVEWQNRVVTIARLVASGAVPEVLIHETSLNVDPYVLGLPGGKVVDLRTGNVRSQQKSDMVTLSTAIDYDPGTSRSLFVDTLARALGSLEVLNYLQLLAGATLVGNPAKLFVVLHGPPDTGKTLFLVDSMARALGSYAVQLDPHKALGASSERAELWWSRAIGRRLVVLSEPSRSLSVNVALIKAMTGRGALTVRRLYEQPLEVVPTWTAWVDTNWVPEVAEPDDAFWLRVRRVEFRNQIRPAPNSPEYDPNFQARWDREAVPACLAWMIEGAVQVLAAGTDASILERPSADATDEWRQDATDGTVHGFLQSSVVSDPEAFLSRDELWQAYLEWAATVGASSRMSRAALYQLVREMGISDSAMGGVRGFRARLVVRVHRQQFQNLAAVFEEDHNGRHSNSN